MIIIKRKFKVNHCTFRCIELWYKIEKDIFQGQYGLGIMIVEGKHADVGQGIFISDVQEGSVAEQVSKKVD